MLKIIDFSKMNKQLESFLIHFLLDFLVNANDDVFAACIARIGSGADRMGIRDGLMIFLKRILWGILFPRKCSCWRQSDMPMKKGQPAFFMHASKMKPMCKS